MGQSFRPEDFTLPVATPSNKTSSNFNPADFAIPDTSQMVDQQKQGFFSSLYHRAVNLPWVAYAEAQAAVDNQKANPSIGGFIKSGLAAPVAKVGELLADATGSKQYLASTLANVKQADANYQQGSDIAMGDLGNLFGRVKDSWNQFTSGQAKPAVDPNVQQDGFFTALGKGLVGAFTAPIDALIGVDMTKPYNPAFTPQEEADKIKQGVAIGVSTMLTPAAGALVSGAGAGGIATGLAEGAVGGVSYGAVAGANTDQQVNQMFQGLVMAPLGAAFEIVGKHFEVKNVAKLEAKNKAFDAVADPSFNNQVQDQAYTLANTKQLMYDENKSTMDLVSNAANLADSHTVDEALVKSMVGNNPDQPFIVRGALSDEAKSQIGENRIISSLNPDNPVHLILPADTELEATPANIFRQTGFLPEQNVLVNGKAYEFGNIASDGKAWVIDNTNNSHLVDLADVQHPSEFSLAKFNDDYSINPRAGTVQELYNNYKSFASGSGGVTVKQVPSTQVAASEFKLPASLTKSAPKYGFGNALYDVGFSSDFNKAAYILAGSGRSAAHASFENAVTQAGFDINDVIAHGNIIRRDLKLQAKSLKSQGIFRGAIQNDTQFQPTSSFGSGIPKVDTIITPRPFEDVVRGFMNRQGFDPSSFDSISNTLQNQIRLESLSNMSPSDLADYHIAMSHQLDIQAGTLADQIQSSGLSVDYNGSGGITLRDNTGKVVTNVGSSTELSDFLSKSGGSNGIKLDSNFTLPAEISGLNLMSDPKAALIDARATGWQKGYGGIVSSNPVFADRASFFSALDTRWGTNTVGIFEKLQRRAIESRGVLKPLKQQMDNIAKSLGKITDTRLKTLYQSLETASPSELEARSTGMEISLAKQMGGNDVKPSANFVNQRNRVMDDATLDNAGKEQAIQTLTAAINPDKSIVDLIDKTVAMPVQDASLDHVLRLARAYSNPENALSRVDFMKKYNFTNAEVAAHQGIVDVLSKAADLFGIDKSEQIFNYITHKKLYDPAISSPTLFKYATETGKFNSDLMRSGLLTQMDENPFHVVGSYLDEGANNRFMQPLVDQSRTMVESELVKNANSPTLSIPDAARPQILKQFDGFLNDLRGRSPEANKYTQAAKTGGISTAISKLPGLSKFNQVNWISEINKAQTYATQAGIPGKGIRDFATLWQSASAKLGYAKANELATIAIQGLRDGSVRRALDRN